MILVANSSTRFVLYVKIHVIKNTGRKNVSHILLVQPDFPIPTKSKWHHLNLPIGLLKLANYHRQKGNTVELVKANQIPEITPEQVEITSYFTYWAIHVWRAVAFYRRVYPNAKIRVGGIYATLMPKHCAQSGCDEVFIGLHPEAEKYFPAYDLVGNPNFQIMHTSRGCFRRCSFCGVWKIEPNISFKRSIKEEICSNWIVFYDNNLLANPYLEDILDELQNARHAGRHVYFECQCGLDGRLLKPKLAQKLYITGLREPRIAWDHSYEDWPNIKDQIEILIDSGYYRREIQIFMLYNWAQDFIEMEKKRKKCWEFGVQIIDCRYRPLNQTYDRYDPYARLSGQTYKDYYIHPLWTDAQIREFRKNIREQNICIRHGFTSYSRKLERAGRKAKRQSL